MISTTVYPWSKRNKESRIAVCNHIRQIITNQIIANSFIHLHKHFFAMFFIYTPNNAQYKPSHSIIKTSYLLIITSNGLVFSLLISINNYISRFLIAIVRQNVREIRLKRGIG